MQTGCVTGAPFIDYLTSELEGEQQKHSVKQNLALKILLLVRNAPGHPTFQDLYTHTLVPFIPPNSTPLI
jgi:hypothetical protein